MGSARREEGAASLVAFDAFVLEVVRGVAASTPLTEFFRAAFLARRRASATSSISSRATGSSGSTASSAGSSGSGGGSSAGSGTSPDGSAPSTSAPPSAAPSAMTASTLAICWVIHSVRPLGAVLRDALSSAFFAASSSSLASGGSPSEFSSVRLAWDRLECCVIIISGPSLIRVVRCVPV
ncbi:hypothetical protein D9T14_11240 [Propionibacterium australiense]|nr:hypothetical protein D9T14_11240 [Propionibacterium australiense]